MMALVQIVELEKFPTRNCRMEIIHLRSAPMGLKELVVPCITGLLVKNPPFILFEYLSSFQ